MASVSENSYNAFENGKGKRMDSQCTSPSAHSRRWVSCNLSWFLRVEEGEGILLLGPSIIIIVKLC